MKPCEVASAAGSGLAVVGGLSAAAMAQVNPVVSTPAATVVGLMMAFTGVVTAIGGQLIPVVRLWFEDRRTEREAKMARHDLANKLQVAQYQIAELELRMRNHDQLSTENSQLIEKNRDLIRLLARRGNHSLGSDPGPSGGFKDAEGRGPEG